MLIMSNFDQKPFDYYTPREYSRSESTQPPRSMSFTESLPMSSTPASPDAQGGIQQAAVGRSLAHNNYSMAGVTATFPGPPDGHQYRALQASRFPCVTLFLAFSMCLLMSLEARVLSLNVVKNVMQQLTIGCMLQMKARGAGAQDAHPHLPQS